MLVVGLTGGICCGKTTVSTMFTELGCLIIDADLISRQLVEPGAPAYKRIVKFFGTEILNRDKMLDRKKLGGIIFADAEKRKVLNSILHPAIIREEERLVREEEQKGERRIAIVSAALMIEAGTHRRFRKIIVVYCTRETQIARIMKREKVTRKEALLRIKSQLAVKEKKKQADYLINTSGPFPQTRKHVVQIYEKLKRLAER